MTVPPARSGKASGSLMRMARGIDDSLSTRPLFAVVFGAGGLPWVERAQVAGHVVRALAGHHGRRVGWAIREPSSALWLRHVRRGRVAKGGMRPVIGLDGWWQATTPAAVHRCRIALGRLRGRFGRGSVALFCGRRAEAGGLPVYVLLDGLGQVVDMAFDAGNGRLSPGIGALTGSPVTNRPALRALSSRLSGGAPDTASIDDFFPEAGGGTGLA
jgi:hypothetical protein